MVSKGFFWGHGANKKNPSVSHNKEGVREITKFWHWAGGRWGGRGGHLVCFSAVLPPQMASRPTFFFCPSASKTKTNRGSSDDVGASIAGVLDRVFQYFTAQPRFQPQWNRAPEHTRGIVLSTTRGDSTSGSAHVHGYSIRRPKPRTY